MKILKVFFLAGLMVVLNNPTIAQEAKEDSVVYGWKNRVVTGLNLTQASFDNWEQGGENTLAWQLKMEMNFTNDQEKFVWVNNGKFTLGFAKVGDDEAKKSADLIDIESVYTRKRGKYLSPFLAVTGKTQFAAGFQFDANTKTKVSQFLDPGYFTQSLGLGYISQDRNFTSRIGVMVKETITSDFPSPYADDPDTGKIEKTKVEPGITSVTNLKMQFNEDVIFTSKMDIFSDFEAFNRIDMTWENNLTLKVAKYINVSLDLVLFYDRDITRKLQIKQVLAVGFTYALL